MSTVNSGSDHAGTGSLGCPAERQLGSDYNPRIVSLIHPAFPIYLHFGRYIIHPHFFFELLSYIIAFYAYLALRRRFGDPIVTPLRWAAVAAAVAGAALGAKLLFLLEDPRLTLANLHNPGYLLNGGKTIVGALVGGLIAVELMKRYIGLRTSTGDLYAIPLAVGIAIGRIGCFLTGLADNTYGTPSNLPWAINFGDGIPRHPTQLYEAIFLLALIPILYLALRRIVILSEAALSQRDPTDVILSEAATKRSEVTAQAKDRTSISVATAVSRNSEEAVAKMEPILPGDAFKLFMVAYASFRLLCDFIKPYPRIFFGLGGIQWACVLLLLYYASDIVRWLRPKKFSQASRT